MPEIKSTLDLIMEKTKNLSMTEEERQELRLKELQAKVKGWMQRYLDGLIDTATVQEHLAGMPEEQTVALDFFRKAALTHIELEGNNERILRFLQEVLCEDIGPLSQRIESFKTEKKKQQAGFTKDALHDLEEKGIRGSAVMPNLNQYPHWQAWRASARESFMQSLK
jgi:hypothetical protein